jgi:hypothetical protein
LRSGAWTAIRLAHLVKSSGRLNAFFGCDFLQWTLILWLATTSLHGRKTDFAFGLKVWLNPTDGKVFVSKALVQILTLVMLVLTSAAILQGPHPHLVGTHIHHLDPNCGMKKVCLACGLSRHCVLLVRYLTPVS